jgi:hypothetical protein
MGTESAPNLVVFYAALPVTIDRRYRENEKFLTMVPELIDYDALESFLKPFKEDYLKCGEGVFVMDEDPCYPGLIEMIQHCQKQKYFFAIFPLGEDAVSMAPGLKDLGAWLSKRGARTRFAATTQVGT